MTRVATVVSPFLLLVLSLCCRSLEPATRFSVTWLPGAVLRIADESHVNYLDVRDGIVGCVGQLFDPLDPASSGQLGSGEGPGQILDVVRAGRHQFVLASAVSAPNCNVQGRCGAADSNVTLIWLRIGPHLSLEDKRAFAVEDCYEPRYVEDVAGDWPQQLHLSNGRLVLKFTELVDSPDKSKLVEVTGWVRYDHANAKAGLKVVRPSR